MLEVPSQVRNACRATLPSAPGTAIRTDFQPLRRKSAPVLLRTPESHATPTTRATPRSQVRNSLSCRRCPGRKFLRLHVARDVRSTNLEHAPYPYGLPAEFVRHRFARRTL